MTARVAEGDVLGGKYRVERILGEGGMGVVVAATHMQLQERVALKFLLLEVTEGSELATRFLREAQAAFKIKSEHVARVSDVGTLETGAPYMVMEYLDGEDLDAVIRRGGALPVPLAVEYLLQACEAIAEAHKANIVHRDLKPSNLFLIHRSDGTPCIKVLDFGISKVSQGPGVVAEPSLTRTSGIMGTPCYMSPEQLRSSRDVDARADIWSLGVILFELLTTHLPFEQRSVAELCSAILTQPAPRVRSLQKDVPAGLESVIAKCLKKDTEDRYASVADLARALGPFAPERSQGSVNRIVATCEPKLQALAEGAAAAASDEDISNAPTLPFDASSDDLVLPKTGSWRRPAFVAVALVVLTGVGFLALRSNQAPPVGLRVSPAPPPVLTGAVEHAQAATTAAPVQSASTTTLPLAGTAASVKAAEAPGVWVVPGNQAAAFASAKSVFPPKVRNLSPNKPRIAQAPADDGDFGSRK